MSADNQMPKDLRDAFRVTIFEVRDWFWCGGNEPGVLLNRIPHSVSEICLLAEEYGDEIPMDEGDVIYQLCLDLHVPGPADPFYGTHARCLGKVCQRLNEKRARQIRNS